jgi:hypothetical protein
LFLRPKHTHVMATETQRLWLMFPPRLITKPIVWELGRKFELVTNIRHANVNDEVGIISLALDGEPEVIAEAIAWLETEGVKVEPVEMNTIAS